MLSLCFPVVYSRQMTQSSIHFFTKLALTLNSTQHWQDGSNLQSFFLFVLLNMCYIKTSSKLNTQPWMSFYRKVIRKVVILFTIFLESIISFRFSLVGTFCDRHDMFFFLFPTTYCVLYNKLPLFFALKISFRFVLCFSESN